MAAKGRRAKQEPAGRPRLTVPRAELDKELAERVAAGEEILKREIDSKDDIQRLRDDFYTWDEYNERLLKSRFTTGEVGEDYRNVGGAYTMDPTPEEEVTELHRDLSSAVRRIASINNQLGLYEEPAQPAARAEAARPAPESTSDIFIVHGHDSAKKVEIARFLEKIGLRPVILHEQANAGRTLIEKFEHHAGQVGYAVVLLTGDDRGGPEDAEALSPRARQNVVFELGFFYGALGRNRVCVLFEDGVEKPSDVDGIAYVSLEGDWKIDLAKELKSAGLDFDFNKVFR